MATAPTAAPSSSRRGLYRSPKDCSSLRCAPAFTATALLGRQPSSVPASQGNGRRNAQQAGRRSRAERVRVPPDCGQKAGPGNNSWKQPHSPCLPGILTQRKRRERHAHNRAAHVDKPAQPRARGAFEGCNTNGVGCRNAQAPVTVPCRARRPARLPPFSTLLFCP